MHQFLIEFISPTIFCNAFVIISSHSSSQITSFLFTISLAAIVRYCTVKFEHMSIVLRYAISTTHCEIAAIVVLF